MPEESAKDTTIRIMTEFISHENDLSKALLSARIALGGCLDQFTVDEMTDGMLAADEYFRMAYGEETAEKIHATLMEAMGLDYEAIEGMGIDAQKELIRQFEDELRELEQSKED